MPQFNVIVTRDCTESTVIDVVAASETEAQAAAMAELQGNRLGFTWVQDDCSGDQSEPYVTGADLVAAAPPATELLFTGMCLWEAVLDAKEKSLPIQAAFETHGTCTVRDAVCGWVEQVEADWKIENASDYYNGVFDWEFVPDWIDTRVNWRTFEILPSPAALVVPD